MADVGDHELEAELEHLRSKIYGAEVELSPRRMQRSSGARREVRVTRRWIRSFAGPACHLKCAARSSPAQSAP